MQVLESPKIVAAATSLAAILVVAVMFWRQRKRQRTQREVFKELKIPSKWTKVGEVEELIFYPLKGGRRKCVAEAEFTKIGLREILQDDSKKMALQDRVFVVYNDKNEFVSLKKNPMVLKIETSAVNESKVKFSYPGEEDLIVEIPTSNNNTNEIQFYYGEKVKSVDCGDEAAAWFSRVLHETPGGVRLGCFVRTLLPPRTLEGAFEKQRAVYPKLHSEYFGAFSDMASYMLMSAESVSDLNARLERPVSEHHFRPNIMVKGCPAYSEDSWDWVRIGDDVMLRGFKYCTRYLMEDVTLNMIEGCVVTTINPDTTEKDPSVEPLRTLRSYRQVKEPELKKVEGNSPVMGLYLGCHRTGTVKVGDPVYVAAE